MKKNNNHGSNGIDVFSDSITCLFSEAQLVVTPGLNLVSFSLGLNNAHFEGYANGRTNKCCGLLSVWVVMAYR